MCVNMKSTYIYALVFTCLIMKGYSETIQCYECDDCKILDDNMLQSCPPAVTTPSSEEKTSSESSSSTDASTTTIAGDVSADSEEANDVGVSVNHQVRNPQQFLKRVSRKTHQRFDNKTPARDTGYLCYSIVKVDGEKREIKKGCIDVPDNKKGCEILKEQEGVSEGNCRVCSETKCNSSAALKYSFVTVFMVYVLKAFL